MRWFTPDSIKPVTAQAVPPAPPMVPAPATLPQPPPSPLAQTAPAAPAVPPAEPRPQAAQAVPPAGAVPAPDPAAPSFDVVRIGPRGDAVLAGRAAPGADVTVRDGDRALGQARADNRGEWVVLPSAPLAPGGRELTLSSRDAAGAETKGDAPVLLVVPERAAPPPAQPTASVPAAPAPTVPASVPVPPATALAVLVPSNAPPRVLQAPAPADAPRPSAAAPPSLGLDAVDYAQGGDIRFAGSAAPNAPVRVYVDDAPSGDAQADAQGRWAMTPREAIIAGLHRVRVDQLQSDGRVAARVELPFQRAFLPDGAVPEGKVVVQPSENLWRLARHAYGRGIRYTVIYQANRDQIRNPRLIYPGQTFAVPPANP